jgi:hypothetical protein
MGKTILKQKGKSLIPRRNGPLASTPVQAGQTVFIEYDGRTCQAYCFSVGNGVITFGVRAHEDTEISEITARSGEVRLFGERVILGENNVRTYSRDESRYNHLDRQLRSARL